MRCMGPEFRSAITLVFVSFVFVRLRGYSRDGDCASLKRTVSQSIEVGRQLVTCSAAPGCGEQNSENPSELAGFRDGGCLLHSCSSPFMGGIGHYAVEVLSLVSSTDSSTASSGELGLESCGARRPTCCQCTSPGRD